MTTTRRVLAIATAVLALGGMAACSQAEAETPETVATTTPSVDLEAVCHDWVDTEAGISLLLIAPDSLTTAMGAGDILGVEIGLDEWSLSLERAAGVHRTNPLPEGAPAEWVVIHDRYGSVITAVRDVEAQMSDAVDLLDVDAFSAANDELAVATEESVTLADLVTAAPRCNEW
jgi:hypothetical protein